MGTVTEVPLSDSNPDDQSSVAQRPLTPTVPRNSNPNANQEVKKKVVNRSPPPPPTTPPPIPSNAVGASAYLNNRRRDGKSLFLQKNPISRAPSEKTNKFRVRGHYSEAELFFVKQELSQLGYSVTLSNDDWDVMWTIRVNPEEYKILSDFQRVNYMPGLQYVCSKNLLHGSICSARNVWVPGIENLEIPEDEKNKLISLAKCDFWPVGFNLEEENQFQLLEQLYTFHEENRNGEDLLFIIKKPFSSCGRGVELVGSMAQLKQIKENPIYLPLEQHKPLAQQYIKNVKLFDGFKFTVRLYIAITGVDPLRVYIFRDGILRICSKKYSLDSETIGDIFVHIDSIDVNVKNDEPETISENIPHEGLRCNLITYFNMLEKEDENFDKDKLWSDIKDVVALSMLSAENPFTAAVAGVCKHRTEFSYQCFEVLGYDILIDEDYKPWLLEINHTPSLAPHTNLENSLKKSMIHDLFQLADITSERRSRVRQIKAQLWDKIIIIKQELQEGIEPECFKSNPKLATINYAEVTPNNLWICVDYELEVKEACQFEPILPSLRYSPFNQINKPTKFSNTNFICQWVANEISFEDFLL